MRKQHFIILIVIATLLLGSSVVYAADSSSPYMRWLQIDRQLKYFFYSVEGVGEYVDDEDEIDPVTRYKEWLSRIQLSLQENSTPQYIQFVTESGEIRYMSYERDDAGNYLTVEHDADGNWLATSTFTPGGLFISHADHNAQGELLFATFSYFDSGYLSEESSYDSLGAWIYTLEYDESGNVVGYTFFDEDGIGFYEIYSYDDAGELIEKSIFDAEGNWMSTDEYDPEMGLVTASAYIDDAGRVWYEMYSYDGEGRLLEKSIFNDLTGTWISTDYYDYESNIVERYYPDGRVYARDMDSGLLYMYISAAGANQYCEYCTYWPDGTTEYIERYSEMTGEWINSTYYDENGIRIRVEYPGRAYNYDPENGRLTRYETDTYYQEYEYPAEGGKIISRHYLDGREIVYTYNADNKLTRYETDAYYQEYEYPAEGGKIISRYYPDGRETVYTYNADNKLTRYETDTYYQEYEYPAEGGKIISRHYPDGREIVYTYNADNKLTRYETDTYYQEYEYPAEGGKHVSRTYANGEKVAYRYNAENVRTKTTTYTSDGFPKSIYDYDENGTLITYTAYNDDGTTHPDSGFKTMPTLNYRQEYIYPAEGGKIISRHYPDGREIVYTYNADNKLTRYETDTYYQEYEYPAEGGKHVSRTYANGEKVAYRYNAENVRTKTTTYTSDGFPKSIYDYDENGTLITYTAYNDDGTTHPDSGFKTMPTLNYRQEYTYPAEGGREIVRTYANGEKVAYRYNAENVRTKTTTYTSDGFPKSIYDYDENGTLITYTAYNDDGTTHPDSGFKTMPTLNYRQEYTYPAEGGKIISRHYPDGREIVYTYNADNKLTRYETDTYYQEYEYPAEGGKIISRHYPDGREIVYTYNADNKLTRYETDTYYQEYEYPAEGGKIISRHYPDGREIVYTYNADNKPTERFAKRTHNNIHILAHTRQLCYSTTRITKNTRSMRLINHQRSVIFLF